MPVTTPISSASLPSASDISMIITDVDGTLLTSTHSIHPRTLSAFRKLREKHPEIVVVIASGKQFASCEWIRKDLGLDDMIGKDGKRERCPAIHCNGSIIYSGGTVYSPSSPSMPSSSRSEMLPPLPILAVTHIKASIIISLVENTIAYGTFLFTADEAILVNKGTGVNKKDWAVVAGRYDRNVVDATDESGDEDGSLDNEPGAKVAVGERVKRMEVLKKVESGEIRIVKVTVCADECDLDSKHFS